MKEDEAAYAKILRYDHAWTVQKVEKSSVVEEGLTRWDEKRSKYVQRCTRWKGFKGLKLGVWLTLCVT